MPPVCTKILSRHQLTSKEAGRLARRLHAPPETIVGASYYTTGNGYMIEVFLEGGRICRIHSDEAPAEYDFAARRWRPLPP